MFLAHPQMFNISPYRKSVDLSIHPLSYLSAQTTKEILLSYFDANGGEDCTLTLDQFRRVDEWA